MFVVATANDVTQLPPELPRKGRFHELCFVDLPNERERESIWRLVIQRHGQAVSLMEVREQAPRSPTPIIGAGSVYARERATFYAKANE